MKNKSILITGANIGLGKEVAILKNMVFRL
jgi:NAD(P)-dependent dehydrogenase (short-subunit alcohol dehydrogenase family)